MAYYPLPPDIGLHQEMLQDDVFIEQYSLAIQQHQGSIEGKVVLDVGCGTGILSILCARAGAKRVYALDDRDIAVQAAEIMKANSLSRTVVVLHAHVEDVDIGEKVDAIISRWMGHMLVHESLIEKVIIARDRWLKPSGVILPNIGRLYMGMFTHPEKMKEKLDFWHNVRTADMSAMIPLAKHQEFQEPTVEQLVLDNILAFPCTVKTVNLYKLKIQELESFHLQFELSANFKAPLHGFYFCFDVDFSAPPSSFGSEQLVSNVLQSSPSSAESYPRTSPVTVGKYISLTTAPQFLPTHWKQTLVYLYNPIDLEQDQSINGMVTISKFEDNRLHTLIKIDYTPGDQPNTRTALMRPSQR